MKKNPSIIIGVLTFLLAVNLVKAQQWGDYTLYATQNGTTSYLVDTNGTTYHTWTHASTAKTGYSYYMMPGGYLWRGVARSGNSFTGGPICGEVQKVNYNGTVVWDFVYSTTSYCTHHDICPMPNGNVLLISYETKTAAEATQAGSSTAITMWPDKIVEVQPTGATTGTVVWEWHIWDHLVQNYDASKSNYQSSISAHPELMNINYKTAKDWIHMNGIDYNPILDQITFSSHNMSEIYVIDHSTTTAEAASHAGGNSGKGGDFLYRWGNPAAYGGTGTAVLNVVHDARWIRQGCPRAGQISGFDNNGISTSQSSGDIFTPAIDPSVNGMTYTVTAGSPATYSKRYALSGHAQDMGSVQQLPNGNMLFSMGTVGAIYETDSSGTTLWSKTLSGPTAKASRYAACFLSDTFALPVITANGNVLTSTTASHYQWYYNGTLINGATSQSYTATQDGFYTVEVMDQALCVRQYAALFNYTSASGISAHENASGWSVYPNPSTGVINIYNTKLNYDNCEITVTDSYGKLVLKNSNVRTIDLSAFDNGFYFVTISSSLGTTVKKISITR